MNTEKAIRDLDTKVDGLIKSMEKLVNVLEQEDDEERQRLLDRLKSDIRHLTPIVSRRY